MAPGRPPHRPTLPAVCPLHDKPQRTPSEDPANPHVSAEHPQQLELPLLTTTDIVWTQATLKRHLPNFCFDYHQITQTRPILVPSCKPS